jgi:hypothetical protein
MSASDHLNLAQFGIGAEYIPPVSAIDMAQVKGPVVGMRRTSSGMLVPHQFVGLPDKGTYTFGVTSAGLPVTHRIPGY